MPLHLLRPLPVFFLLGLILEALSFGPLSASTTPGKDSLRIDTSAEISHTRVTDMLDELVHAWYKQYQSSARKDMVDSLNNDSMHRPVSFPPEVYQRRLDSVLTPIAMPYNRVVQRFIDLYVRERRDQMRGMLALKDYYFPMFEEALDKAGLPTTLKYMPVIESALNPTVRSRAGAVGIWQFMYGTAKMYGLDINYYIDERRDPYMSTQAAIAYLKDMYAIYGDWLLVIASYNCGPGNVNKAIRRSGGHYDFWKIYRYLPRETRGYVPAFIAATYAFKYAEAHRLYPNNIRMPLAVDTVQVSRELRISELAQRLGTSEEALRNLNPQYRRDLIPGDRYNAYLRLPIKQVGRYCELMKQDSLALARQVEQAVEKATDGETKEDAPKQEKRTEDDGQASVHTIYYTVKPGDNLGYIAEWFSTTASQLRRWNQIYGHIIHVGDRLKVQVPANRAKAYEGINELTFTEKQRRFVHAAKETAQGRTSRFYTVRRGDSLWGIAQRLPGVSVNDIKRWNRIRGNALRPGQRLILFDET